jgi:hypothetical protein
MSVDQSVQDTPSFGPGLAYDPVIGHRFSANVRSTVPFQGAHYEVVTNSAGLRSTRDYSRTVPRTAKRIVLLGDSFAAGDGVDNQDRFSDILEQRNPNLEILNCGLPGSGTDQQFLLFRQIVTQFDYDALLFCPLVENIRRNVARYRPALQSDTSDPLVLAKPYFKLDGEVLHLCNVPVPEDAIRLRSVPARDLPFVDTGGTRRSSGIRKWINAHAAGLKPLLIELSRFQPHPEYDDPGSDAWRLMRAILEAAITLSRPRPVIIAPLPYYIHIEHPRIANYMPRFRELETLDVKVIDILPRFLQLSPSQRRACRLNNDPHYSPLAHRVVADVLEQELDAVLAGPEAP